MGLYFQVARYFSDDAIFSKHNHLRVMVLVIRAGSGPGFITKGLATVFEACLWKGVEWGKEDTLIS